MCQLNIKIVLLLFGSLQGCVSEIGTPPKVEEHPLYLASYIPASMQILAYLTESLKYDLRPQTTPAYGPTTPSTIRPTPYHRPAIYQPLRPPGPSAYFASVETGYSYRKYVESLKRPSGANYFDRYQQAVVRSNKDNQRGNEDILEGVTNYFGKNFIDTLKLVKDIEKDVVINDIDEQSQEFLKKYDDSNFRSELLRQKQVPPTRAYVTLLSLYDMFNKESKRLGLSKYNGYTEQILKELVKTSSNTSAYQLRLVLKKVVERKDTTKSDIVKKINQLVAELDDNDSYMNLALKYISPLTFAL